MARWIEFGGRSVTISLESPNRSRCVVGTSFSSRSILAVASASLAIAGIERCASLRARSMR